MPAAILGPVAGSVVGGLMSKGGGSQTASKEPWGPVQPWLKEMVRDGQDMYQNYQQNPFNPLQQTAYRNTFADIDNFRSGVMPGLLAITNKYVAGSGGPAISLLGNNATAPGGGGTQTYGLLDFDALNPYRNGQLDLIAQANKPKSAEEERKEKEEEERQRLMRENEFRGAGA